MKIFSDIGIQIPQIFMPRGGVDLKKWAVIACDQFTSEPEYWQEVERIVGDAPSSLNLVFPEVYLDKPGEEERIKNIQANMRKYMDKGILQTQEGFIYVERKIGSKVRKGLILCLDLERYNYNKGSQSLIRATEGTIVERLPPRIKIRQGASMELPHILVLIDDPKRTVIEPISAIKNKQDKIYDFDLMLDSGHLTGYKILPEYEEQIIEALRGLIEPRTFAAKYGVKPDLPPLLFAMGDGNHSLATAKAIWEKMKPQVGIAHPSRYALVEIENVHDDGLEFEPIHRVLFNLKKDMLAELKNTFGENLTYTEVANGEEMTKKVDSASGPNQLIGLVGGGKQFGVIEIAHPTSNLAVGTI